MPKQVIMPALGMAQETGTLVRWFKASGDRVRAGEPIAEIMTDKASVELEAPADGILTHIVAGEGDEVPVGHTIATVLRDGESLDLDPSSAPPSLAAQEPALAPSVAHAASVATSSHDADTHDPSILTEARVTPRLRAASPMARRLASEHGVSLADLRGSGPNGTVLAADVLAAARVSPPAPPVLSANGSSPAPVSARWRIMAERTTRSWQEIPHFFVAREVNASQLVAWRTAMAQRSHERITYSDLLVKLTAAALQAHARLNASWSDNAIVTHPDINIGLAVATEDGLAAPVIHRADQLALPEIARRRTELVQRANAGKLSLEDVSGGTFTISNLGMYAIDAFSAIIVPPQVAILAVGRVVERVVPLQGVPTTQPMMTLNLSCDHRAVDGVRAARFLGALADLIESPVLLLN